MSYIIRGKVIKGDGYGRKIGFPTANIDREYFSALAEKPKMGVYSGKVNVLGAGDSEEHRAGIIIGPLDDKKLPKIEAHLLDFDKDIYGKEVIFTIDKFIREFMNFNTEKELIAQIKKDLKKC